MPLVGEKEIFAIEWKINHSNFSELKTNDFPHTLAYFRYWARSIPIGNYKTSVLLDAVISFTKDFLINEYKRQQIDFTDYDTETALNLLCDATFSASLDIKYASLFQSCRKQLIEKFSEMLPPPKGAKKYVKSQFKSAQKYIKISSDNPDNQDFNDSRLAAWIDRSFSLSDLGGASFWDSVDIYLITDKQISQERLIWRTKPDNNVFCAYLPLGYFMNIANHFIMETLKPPNTAFG